MKQFPRMLAVCFLLVLASLISCSDNSSLINPESSPSNTPTSFDEITSMTEGVSQGRGTTVYSTTVDSLGGTLDGPDADFSVTASALSVTTTITMTVDDNRPNEVAMGPSGQQFSEPCLLLMDKPSGYSAEDDYSIFWWDTANSTWVDLEAGNLGPVVVVSINHFSLYKIDLAE